MVPSSYPHPSVTDDTACALTAIEEERLANIKKNHAVLVSVGLASHGLAASRPKNNSSSLKGVHRLKRPPKPPTLPTRRSIRNLGRDAPDYKEDGISYALTSSPPAFTVGPRHKWNAEEDAAFSEKAWDAPSTAVLASTPTGRTATPGSSRTRTADVSRLAEYLGKPVPYTGKQCVIDLMSPANEDGQGPVKFSKYAGVVEWQNCVVLWVNADGHDYENLFLGNGRQMTWFAGSRVTAETPVMLRLLAAGRMRKEEERKTRECEIIQSRGAGSKPAEIREDGGGQEDILLFCRRQGQPYVFMGRIWYVWYEVNRHPIKVLWELRDFEAIRDSPHVREVMGGVDVEKEGEAAGRVNGPCGGEKEKDGGGTEEGKGSEGQGMGHRGKRARAK